MAGGLRIRVDGMGSSLSVRLPLATDSPCPLRARRLDPKERESRQIVLFPKSFDSTRRSRPGATTRASRVP